MADHSSAAQAYIRAESDLRVIKAFRETVKDDADFKLHVTWSRASACVGYEETRLAVQRLVEPQLRDLLAAAYTHALKVREEAFNRLNADMHHGG